MIHKLNQIGREIIGLIYPYRCPVCDDVVGDFGEKICLKCMKRLKYLLPPWCVKCGKKVENGEAVCADCRKKHHVYDRGRALYEYESVAGSIYRLKYGGRREYADFFGEQIAEYLVDFIRSVQPDALVPIPLHPKRKRARGYNQAELLALALGRQLEIPVNTRLLRRTRNTVPQKLLNPSERQNNLKKAFKITENDVKSKVIILIDDIYTTGATMDEAARVLKAAGVEKVFCISLACGAGV